MRVTIPMPVLLAALYLLALALTGCATTQAIQTKVAGDAVDALTKLKAAPALQVAPKDAAATKAWIATQPFDPITLLRASACPDAVLAASGDFSAKVDALIGVLQAMQTPPDPALADGRLILLLTKAKFGQSVNPQMALGTLKQDVAARVDLVVTSCIGLIPYKQIKEILQLATQAGLVPEAGPFAGPLTGILFSLAP